MNDFSDGSTQASRPNLARRRAHWVRRDLILWDVQGSSWHSYALFASPVAGLELRDGRLQGGIEIPLEFDPAGPDEEIRLKFPHLAHYSALRLPAAALGQVAEALRCQLAITIRDGNGWLMDVCGLQIPGVMDDLYTYPGALGPVVEHGKPVLRVWAPSARSVMLRMFDSVPVSPRGSLAALPCSVCQPMQFDQATGAWSLAGDSSWLNRFYLYEVEVYVPLTGRIEKNLVTDPYSISLSTNSRFSQFVDLRSQALMPPGWDQLRKPALDAPEDIVLYELHVRDFSAYDSGVPAAWRGTFKAFCAPDSNGLKHLKRLAEAGLTHIHLLPTFDIATINEDKSSWPVVDDATLLALPPDSDQQQALIGQIAEQDGFNWGYDPYHYTTPEGSYSTDPHGSQRVLEFRQMVQALSQAGLRVIMDVVYNHTNASGMEERSVLDKVVPGYYHRLDMDGNVEQSTCCSNTASEHAMMRKLMIDSMVTWACEYKVDGFRFDLMGHHMLADMKAVRDRLAALTLEKDGVDGKSMYIYGEGWNFGEVAYNARGVNATQQNIAGTGIGAFNDRLRDAVRGGSAFGNFFEQGYVTGLYFRPNQAEWRDAEQQRVHLNEISDWIRVTLAGNLLDYELVRANGDKVPARWISYGGGSAPFALDPQENVIYVAAHDNETLWDILQVKLPVELELAEKVRLNNLALSLVAFSQGVPFFHAGDDMLRSKSLDRNSYNSGDWFNRLDWTYETNNWGVGLPAEGRDRWDVFRPLLGNPALKPGKAEISFSAAVFRELLRIRKSSPLFRLRTAAAVQRSVSFLNSGYQQIPGLIVMNLVDVDNLDPLYQAIVVLFNASPEVVNFSDASFVNLKLELHPVLAGSVDDIIRRADFDTSKGEFCIPGRSTAVFVLRKKVRASRK
jgi:pullulanase-type alpha-1,6-glucosidase